MTACPYIDCDGWVVFLWKKWVCLVLCGWLASSSCAQGLDCAVSAQACALIDAESGRVLYAVQGDTPLPMASTTKIMTALVALEQGDLEDVVTIDAQSAGVEGSSLYLAQGEHLTLEQLLYGLMLESGNDAAVAIAAHVGGTVPDFVEMMNRKAQGLGLSQTHFENPNGLPADGHQTTAVELARLAAEALKREDFATIVSTRQAKIPYRDEAGQFRYLTNSNRLLESYEGCMGVKTGYTKAAGRCLVTAAQREDIRLVCVTLNDPDDWRDHEVLLDAGFASVERRTFAQAQNFQVEVPVVGSEQQQVCAVLLSDVTAVGLSEQLDQASLSVELPHFLYAPVRQGEPVGCLVLTTPDGTRQDVPLVAAEGVESTTQPSLWQRLRAWWGGWS